MFPIVWKTTCYSQWQSKFYLFKHLDTVIAVTFILGSNKAVLIFSQQLLGEQRAIRRMIWSSWDIVAFSWLDRLLAVNIVNIPSILRFARELCTTMVLTFSFRYIINCKDTIWLTNSDNVSRRPYHTMLLPVRLGVSLRK